MGLALPIPKNWSLDRMQRELERSQRLAEQYRNSQPRTADFYDGEAARLVAEMAERRRKLGKVA